MLAVALGALALLVGAVGNTHWHISPSLLTYLSGFAVPLAVGVLTKWHVSSGVKAVCNIVLSAIAGALSVAIASSGDVVLSTWVGGFAQTLVVSIASYYGFWKPTGIAQAVQQKTANFGIGGPAPASASRDDLLPGSTTVNNFTSVPRVDPEVPEPADATVGTVKPRASRKAVQASKKAPPRRR